MNTPTTLLDKLLGLPSVDQVAGLFQRFLNENVLPEQSDPQTARTALSIAGAVVGLGVGIAVVKLAAS